MFKGVLLGITYYSWHAYKIAWNNAVRAGKLFDKNGKRITKIYDVEDVVENEFEY